MNNQSQSPQFKQNFAKPMLVALAVAFALLALTACRDRSGEEQSEQQYPQQYAQQYPQQPPAAQQPAAQPAAPPVAAAKPQDGYRPSVEEIAESARRHAFGGENTAKYIGLSIKSYKAKALGGFKGVVIAYTNNTPYQLDIVKVVASSSRGKTVCESHEEFFYDVIPGTSILRMEREFNCGQTLSVSTYQYDCELETPSADKCDDLD